MRKIATLVGTVGLLTAAWADVKVTDINVSQSAPTANGTNIRVYLHNSTPQLQRATLVQLQARESEADNWVTVKEWNRKMALKGGGRMALDYLPSDDTSFPEVLSKPSFQIRAQVLANGRVLSSSQEDYVANYTALRLIR
jgi:hypothetical protein